MRKELKNTKSKHGLNKTWDKSKIGLSFLRDQTVERERGERKREKKRKRKRRRREAKIKGMELLNLSMIFGLYDYYLVQT